MKLETKITQKLLQTQKLSLKQQQSLKVLEMSSYDLVRLIEDEIADNPLLELNEDYIHHEDFDFDAILDFATTKLTLQEELLIQLHTSSISYHPTLCEYIIESLDQNGYFNQSLGEVATLFHCEEESVEDALYLIQTFEPKGVGARNLQECLAIQCAEMDTPLYGSLMACVNQHLQAIAENKLPEIATKLNISLEDTKKCVALIKSCDPKPASSYSVASNLTTPDITISLDEDQIVIQVKNYTNYLAINHDYDHSDSQDLQLYVKEYTKRINLLCDTLNKRQSTLFEVVNAIVSIQRDYFLSHAQLRPLTLSDLAQMCNIHESTVSRTISAKVLEFNAHYIPLKFFLTSKLDSGQSNNEIQIRLKQLIEQENKKKPYSDDALCEILKAEKIQISRRTITKYREALNIPSSSKRKEF